MRPSASNQSGFVLAVVLWSIAGLTLITGGIVARINHTLEQAFQMRELARLQQDIMATEQTLLYVLSARPLNAAGVDLEGASASAGASNPFDSTEAEGPAGPTLRMDGSLYQGIGSATFSMQDAGATLSLLEPPKDTWMRAMNALKIPRGDADRWYDQLMDYQDRDDLTRLNGIESEGYERLGLPDPPNRFMVTPHELRNLPIATEYPKQTEVLILNSTSATGSMANVNTSPPLMLEIIHYLSQDDAETVAKTRGETVLTSLSQASTEFGVLFQGAQFQTVWQPSGNVRVMIGNAEGRHRRWIAVKFSATANGAPWVIEYSHPVAIRQQQEPDTTDAFSPNPTTEAAPHTSAWPYYSAFFPHQLSLD